MVRIRKIAISGKMNTGKNTIAEMLGQKLYAKEDTWNNYQIFAFADPIKIIIEQMFPQIPKHWLYGPSYFRGSIVPNAYQNKLPLTVRDICCAQGKLGRSFDPNIWVNNTMRRVHNYLDNVQEALALISDLRFLNELKICKEEGFTTVRIVKDGYSGDDISETDLDQSENEFDYILENNGTLEELESKVNALVRILVGSKN